MLHEFAQRRELSQSTFESCEPARGGECQGFVETFGHQNAIGYEHDEEDGREKIGSL